MSTMPSQPVPPAPAAALDYASPQTRAAAAAPPGQKLLVLALAVSAAFLGANAFADATGFPPVGDMGDQAGPIALRILCGLVVFLVSLAVLGALLRGFRTLAGVLARAADRPTLAPTLAMLIGGTACVIATPVIEVVATRSAAPRVTMDVGFGGGVAVQSGIPIAVHLASLAALTVGVALVGIGVWSSLGARRGGGAGSARGVAA